SLPAKPFIRGKDYADFFPDRVAMQDATAQMALLQFMNAGKNRTAVPTTVHCDHLIEALSGAGEDLSRALAENAEVYEFLKSVCARYGMGYWQPGSGIIHQVVLENYSFPGGMMIGTDSHTPTAGGMGMAAIGVGGADAVDVMAGIPWELQWPGFIGVRLTGSLSGWASAKDVICSLLGILTVRGGTGHIVEYFGPGCGQLSATEKAVITDMGAEHGATTSLFPADSSHPEYLSSTGRQDLADEVKLNMQLFRADSEVYETPEKYFDRVVEIDLSSLVPHLNGPMTPDRVWTVNTIKDGVKKNNYTDAISACCLGSCNNASYHDLAAAAFIAKDLLGKGIKARTDLFITPGSDMVRATAERDGILATLKNFGAVILANACGPCIGQWKRPDMPSGTKNTIVNSFNRNFAKRNDGNPATDAFVTSPEIVTVLAAAGRLTFNPLTDTLENGKGEKIRPQAPPRNNISVQYASPEIDLVEPPSDGSAVSVSIDPKSGRLQKLEPFPAWGGRDLLDLPVLFKAKGKCTTDHISPAGPWLEYRGHLDNICGNLLSGAVSAYTDRTGEALNFLDGKYQEVPHVAREYKARSMQWVIVGDDNYGEGSSREHAAMEPRHLGCIAVIVKSFARIHEANLKKQGILALTFADPADYERFKEYDRVSFTGIAEKLKPGMDMTMTLQHKDGSAETITLRHTYSEGQIEWFKAGSALNLIAAGR
ncbi:MAG: aconitate hydratase, partial [Spirochaetales bacterium]